MTQQKRTINGVGGSSVNDNAPMVASAKRGKKSPSGKKVPPKVYPPEIKALTQKIKKIRGQELEVRVEIGLELSRAKDLLDHGDFRPWLQKEFSWSERTATSFMQLARHYEGKTAKFADLDLGTATALVTDKTLEKVRHEVFEQADAGVKIVRKDVRKQIAEVKATQPKRLAKAKAIELSAATESDISPQNNKSPDKEVAEALHHLLSIVQKNKSRCWPDEVARMFVKDDRAHTALEDSGTFSFVSDVTKVLFPRSEAESRIKIAS